MIIHKCIWSWHLFVSGKGGYDGWQTSQHGTGFVFYTVRKILLTEKMSEFEMWQKLPSILPHFALSPYFHTQYLKISVLIL